jgi:hypothetical protein
MKGGSSSLPPIKAIAAALRRTTETIARELAVPSTGTPGWTEFEWDIARAVSAMHGVSALLDARLHWEGPTSWRQFLREQTEQSAGRHLKIKALLESIDHHSRRRGVPIVALKGAALYASKLYAPGERPMGDIDLLVREGDAGTMARVLEDCGHEPAYATQRHQVYQPRSAKIPAKIKLGEHMDNPIKVEVHTRIAERLPITVHDITRFLFPIAAHEGLNAYPAPTSLMMHLLLHAAGNMRPRALRLLQLHDIALLSARLAPTDWERLAAGPDGRTLWWALAPLMLMARYYPVSIPPSIYSRLGAECTWYLRARSQRQHVTDVSWSRIRIEAFPGLEWSRSAAEAVAFMTSRIWPSPEARLELKEGAAQIPESSTIPWYGISHRARVLRWILSKPPRVQTLLSVRKALTQEV